MDKGKFKKKDIWTKENKKERHVEKVKKKNRHMNKAKEKRTNGQMDKDYYLACRHSSKHLPSSILRYLLFSVP